MNITDEILRAYVAGCEARDAESADEVDGFAIMRAGLEAVAPLIAAQALQEAEERTEWGVRWHGADVAHGTAGDGRPLYDEISARAVADKYANAAPVHRRAPGPWIEAQVT